MEQLSAQKDEDIDAFITSMTNIQTNLDSIKELEGIITARVISGNENNGNPEQAIVDDMLLIYQNMKKTTDQIESLEKKLEQSFEPWRD